MSEQKDTSLWDLIKSFFRWCGRCCLWLTNMLSKQIRISFRKWHIVLPMFIFGIALGLYFSRFENRQYKAQGMALVHGPFAQEVKEAMRPLQMAIPPHIDNSLSLASQLQCPEEYTVGIRRINTYNVVDYLNNITPDLIDFKNKHQLEDTLNLISNSYIVFEVYTKNLPNLRNFENAVVDYLNRNAIIKAKYNVHHQMLEQELDICNRQLNYLDSLTKRFYYNAPKGYQIPLVNNDESNALVLGRQGFDPIHDDILDLLQHTKGVEADLATCTQPIIMVSHISAIPKALNNRILCLILGCLSGWVLGLCVAWCFEDRKEIKKWLTTK